MFLSGPLVSVDYRRNNTHARTCNYNGLIHSELMHVYQALLVRLRDSGVVRSTVQRNTSSPPPKPWLLVRSMVALVPLPTR